MSVLRVVDVVVGAPVPRLQVPSLELGPGLTVVVGENGAGKSTLLDVAAGVLAPTTGAVLLDGSPLSTRTPSARARVIASLGQRPRSAPWLRVDERIAQGLAPRLGARATPDHPAVAHVLEALALGALRHRTLTSLSGGEQQRAHIGRALVDSDAGVVLLDEPFAGLDEGATALVVAVLQARAGAGAAVVVSVHDLGLAALLGGRVLGVANGRVAVDGTGAAALEAAAALLGGRVSVVDDGVSVGVLRRRQPSA
jgi:iron complex transport system ATP-binding protein